jgi:hypothetical protein
MQSVGETRRRLAELAKIASINAGLVGTTSFSKLRDVVDQFLASVGFCRISSA